MNKKGQALVEFVIILPIFILLVLGVIDIGRIMYFKINLEERMSDVVDYYKKNRDVEDIKEKLKMDDYDISIKLDENYANIELVKNIDIITPGLQLIFDNPYKIEVKRAILNE